MWYVYVIKSLKNNTIYVGYTENLKKRIVDHNSGNGGDYTSRNRPYKLIFYEAFSNKTDAIKDEKFFKTGYGREVLQEKIKNSLS